MDTLQRKSPFSVHIGASFDHAVLDDILPLPSLLTGPYDIEPQPGQAELDLPITQNRFDQRALVKPVLSNLVKTGKDRSKVLLRFFRVEVLLDHPNSGAQLGSFPGEQASVRWKETCTRFWVKTGKDRSKRFWVTWSKPVKTGKDRSKLRFFARSPKLRG